MDGNVSIHKAQFVAKGFKQWYGIDYDETFSPVAMLKSIRILLAIVAFHVYEIWHLDVKIAFLIGNLTEYVYMIQPDCNTPNFLGILYLRILGIYIFFYTTTINIQHTIPKNSNFTFSAY